MADGTPRTSNRRSPATGLPNMLLRPQICHALTNVGTSQSRRLSIFDKFPILYTQHLHDQHNVYEYLTMPMQVHSHHQPPPQGQHLCHHHPAMCMSPWNSILRHHHHHILSPPLFTPQFHAHLSHTSLLL